MNQHWTKIKKNECFFAPDISIAYVGDIEKIKNKKKYMESRITRQCLTATIIL